MTAAGELVLECRDLSVGFDEPVLEHVDLEVARGEILAILGRSGGGKSTLLRTMIGLLPPLAGEIRLFGQPLYELGTAERQQLAHRLGVAFQQDALFGSLTLEDNVALPLRELTALREPVIREMVRRRVAQVGLAGLEQHLPAQLSGGERKRAALARATIAEPELLACDEPTAGLDPMISSDIDDVLLQLHERIGSTLVVVSHELSTVRAIASRVVLIAGHRICAAGTVDELEHSRNKTVAEFFHARHA
jgi:phospholipid/cholesterol/gamma-HCH transport system ATP-binding protein